MKNNNGVGVGDYVKIVNVEIDKPYCNGDILKVVQLDDEYGPIWCETEEGRYYVCSDEYEFFRTDNFTKGNLRTGDFVEFHNEDVGIVNVDAGGIAMESGKYITLSSVTDNLGDTHSWKEWEIDRVYRPTEPCTVSFNNHYKGRLIFDRNSIQAQSVKEYTIEELEEKLGEKIKIIGNAA